MKIIKLIFIGRILAIAILMLGVIHDIATFTPIIQSGLDCLKLADFKAVTYMSLVCGTSFILCGFLLVMLIKRVEQYKFISSMVLAIGSFLFLSGVLSVIYMFDNPFAWLAFILNMSMFFVAVVLKIKTN